MDSKKHCYMCEKDFKIGDEFKDHWVGHSSDTKISNSLKDSCKIRCNVCEKSFNFSSFRLHISREHELSQRNYKKRFNIKSFVLSEKFLHKCAVCNVFLLLDSERLRNHMQVKHRGDNITWQDYQLRHMNQEKEKNQKADQKSNLKSENRKIKTVEDLNQSDALNQRIKESIVADADADKHIQVDDEERNEGDNEVSDESRAESTFEEQQHGNKPSDAMLPVKLESPEPLEDMEDPLNIDSEDEPENIDRLKAEESLRRSDTNVVDVVDVEPNAVPEPVGVSRPLKSDGVGCPKCARKFTLTGQLVHMRDNLRCHIGLVHFSHHLAREVAKVFEGTHCQLCDFQSEKKDKRKRHLIYKHTIYVAEILEITETTIKSFIQANITKTIKMDDKTESLKENDKNESLKENDKKESLKENDKKESLEENNKKESLKQNDETESLKVNEKDFQLNIPTEMETEKTLEMSPYAKKNHNIRGVFTEVLLEGIIGGKKNQAAAKDETFQLVADNNDFEKPGGIKRRKPINNVSSMVIEDRRQIESFRRFVARIQRKETAMDGLEKVQLDKERRFSAIELILLLDTVKIRELSK